MQQLCLSLFAELGGSIGFSSDWFPGNDWVLFCNSFLALHRKLGWAKAYARARMKAARLLLDQCVIRYAQGELPEDYADDPGYCRALAIVDGLA